MDALFCYSDHLRIAFQKEGIVDIFLPHLVNRDVNEENGAAVGLGGQDALWLQ